MNLENKICVITGVSKGIGEALVKQLLDKKAIVYGLGRNENRIKHPNYTFLKLDIRNHDAVQNTFAIIFKQVGKVDILVNNAGLGYFGYLEDMPLEQWHELYDTNIHGMFYCTRQVLKGMKQQGEGHIFNISSIAGLEGYQQVAAYCSTKFAVRGLSDALYKEVRDFGIKVTCVYPGSVKTDFFRNSPSIKPHDYMLMPDDVATIMVQAMEMPKNFHQVNLEIRPLQPKGPKSTQ